MSLHRRKTRRSLSLFRSSRYAREIISLSETLRRRCWLKVRTNQLREYTALSRYIINKIEIFFLIVLLSLPYRKKNRQILFLGMISRNYELDRSCTVKNRLTISLLPQFEYRFAGRKRRMKECERKRESYNGASIHADTCTRSIIKYYHM